MTFLENTLAPLLYRKSLFWSIFFVTMCPVYSRKKIKPFKLIVAMRVLSQFGSRDLIQRLRSSGVCRFYFHTARTHGEPTPRAYTLRHLM